FVANALSPSKVVDVKVYGEEKMCRVSVPDYQLSLAIGIKGQNARLAAKLTGWKIDIKSESQYRGRAEEQLFPDQGESEEEEEEPRGLVAEGVGMETDENEWYAARADEEHDDDADANADGDEAKDV